MKKSSLKRIEFNCEFCGKRKEIPPSVYKNSKHHFCSTDCLNKWQATIKGKIHKDWNRVKTSCAFCGNELYKIPYRIKKYKLQFCNRNCFSKWKQSNLKGNNNLNWRAIEKPCLFCGNITYKTPYLLGKHKLYFCNKNCFTKWKKENAPCGENNSNWKSIKMNCDYCGEKIYVTPYKLKNSIFHFCNKTCFDKWERINKPRGEESPVWKGGHFPYYGLHWCDQKKKISDRANNISEISGNNGGFLDAHHVIPMRNFVQKYIDLCYASSIPSIALKSFKVLPYDLFIPNAIFEEANQRDNLVYVTRAEHTEFEGMPPTFFEAIKNANKNI